MNIYSFSKILGLTVLATSLIGSNQMGFAQSSNPTEKIDLFENNSSEEQSNQQVSDIISDIQSIAEKITVRIDYGSNNGSGVIVARDGNTHYVLTAKHVVDSNKEYQVVAPDGQTYPLDYSTIKKEQFGETDLAVFEFQSQTPYDVATLANFEQRAALHQEKKADFDPADPNRISELMSQKISDYETSGEAARIANLSNAIENACPEQKEALEVAPSLANAESYQNCLDKTIKEHEGSGLNNYNVEEIAEKKLAEIEALCSEHENQGNLDLYLECLRVKNEELFNDPEFIAAVEGDVGGNELELNPEKSIEPNVAIDYRIGALFLYGWSKNGGKTSQALFNVGTYHRSNLEESGNLNRSWAKYGEASNFPSPSSEFMALSASADNFNTNSQDYDIFYTNRSYGGMSGGPVLDHKGNLVAIHTGVEGKKDREKLREKYYFLGYSNGIFIDKFLEQTDNLGIASNLLNIENSSQEYLDNKALLEISSAKFYINDNQNLTTEEDWMNYGNQMWRELRFGEAVKAFNKAIEINSNSYLAHYSLGKSLEGFRVSNRIQLEKINQSFKKATELQPDFFPAWKELGDHLHILTYSEIDEIHPFNNKNPEQAYEELMKPKVEKSLYAYDQALALDPNNAYIYSKKGQMYFMQKSCSKALDAFNQAISIEDSAVYHQYKSLIYMAIGNYNEAKKEYEIYSKNKSSFAPPGLFPYQILFQAPSKERDDFIKQQLKGRFLDRC